MKSLHISVNYSTLHLQPLLRPIYYQGLRISYVVRSFLQFSTRISIISVAEETFEPTPGVRASLRASYHKQYVSVYLYPYQKVISLYI